MADAGQRFGGGTLAYCGDPLDCHKVMTHWLKATTEVRRLAADKP